MRSLPINWLINGVLLAIICAILATGVATAASGSSTATKYRCFSSNSVDRAVRLVGSPSRCLYSQDGARGPQGAAGVPGPAGETGETGDAGISCWDGDANGVSAQSEDINGDDAVDVLDCQGAPGEDGEDAVSLWAVISEGGTVQNGSGNVTNVFWWGDGRYDVTFDQDVENCGYSVNVRTGIFFFFEQNSINASSGGTNVINVQVTRGDGFPFPWPFDGFDLQVFC